MLEGSQHHIPDILYTEKANFKYVDTKNPKPLLYKKPVSDIFLLR